MKRCKSRRVFLRVLANMEIVLDYMDSVVAAALLLVGQLVLKVLGVAEQKGVVVAPQSVKNPKPARTRTRTKRTRVRTLPLSLTHTTHLSGSLGRGKGRERRLEGRGNSPHETAETLGEDPVPRRGVVNGDAFVGLALSSSCSRTWTPQSSEQRRWKGESVDAPQSRGSRCARTSCLEERAPRYEGSEGRPKSSTRPRAEVGGREKERGRTHQLRTTAFQSSRNSSGC